MSRGTLQRGAFILLALATWAIVSRFGPWPRALFPGPWAVVVSFFHLLFGGDLVRSAARSLGRLAAGYSLSVLIGVPLGLAMARAPLVRNVLKPVVTGLQALPSICWLPLALLWFGLSDAAILFVVVMGSMLAIAIATDDAVSGIPPQMLMVAGSLGIRGPRLVYGVLVPAAMPGIVTGLKLGWSFAWRALMAGELLFVAGGLGQLLNNGRELLDVPQVMAVMAAIVLVGVAIDRLIFTRLELTVRRRWGLVAPT